ncbi:MAG: hypothetical protein AAB320_01755 [Elusimicrobiota bacterium]
MLRPALACLLLSLPSAAIAAASGPVCQPFGALGCFYAPPAAEGTRTPLLIYLRGWLNGQGQVPPESCLASARQAFAVYQIEKAAAAAQSAVLVTCSSHLGVTPSDVVALEKEAGRGFSGTILAAHSGGYVGLGKTLASGVTPQRIIMLDNFYLNKDLSKKIQAAVYGGAACAGFYTKHNTDGYEKNFKPFVQCVVDYHEDYGHEGGVAKCLPSYLKQTTCP